MVKTTSVKYLTVMQIEIDNSNLTEDCPNKRFPDRDPIHNIWDQEPAFISAKNQLQTLTTPTNKVEADARSLLQSPDPYLVKLGIHYIRLCIWGNPDLASEWVNKLAPSLLEHPNPRIRHSALWNVRSSVWQDNQLAQKALEFAAKGLEDKDPAVQRVSIWVHGDSLINDPQLSETAFENIDDFLTSSPKESNYLFALEEFYIPVRHLYSDQNFYLETIDRIKSQNRLLPGVVGRCVNLLGEKFIFPEAVKRNLHQKIIEQLGFEPDNGGTNQNLDAILNYSVTQFLNSETFLERMKILWIIRDLCWVSPDKESAVFRSLTQTLEDTRDGDLLRTASVVLADLVLKNPEALSQDAVSSVLDFYGHSDIDGSQIVIGQILNPLRNYSDSRALLESSIPSLKKFAANSSVDYMLDNLLS